MSAFRIPGCELEAEAAYDERGTLLRLTVGDTVHVERRPDGAWSLGSGLAVVRELGLPGRLMRRVNAAGRTWTEHYRWDADGLLVEVDGVAVERDGAGRVTACRGPDGAWTYGYGPHGLETIHAPWGERRIARGAHGRPVRMREPRAGATAIAYDARNRRTDVGEDPSGWARDELGRLWTIRGPGGEIVASFLWSGMSCLGRVDGPPDRPLAVAFSLDPTGTPVRVITRDGVRRVPRDAFGEALLAHAGVPGLFGGPVHDGLVRLPLRVADPRTGAFDRPDPLDGSSADPRRAAAGAGVLLAERGPAGPYAICRDDPVGRADPTGGISWAAVPVFLSSVTWSSQYNVVNIAFFQLFLNLFISLVTTDDDGRWNMRRFFSIEPLASKRRGGFGFRFDPAGLGSLMGLFAPGRRFTLHHVFWSPVEDLDRLERVRLFAPDARFDPTCYGTLLRVEPARAKRFALRGANNAPTFGGHFPARTAEPWSRAGGTAEPVFPGSRVPRFPAGGLHFATRFGDDGAFGAQAGALAELAPAAGVPQGFATRQTRLSLAGTGHGLSAGKALLVLAGADRELHEVASAAEHDGRTSVRLRRELVTPLAALRVRGATVAAPGEALPAAGAPVDRLDARTPASTVRYAPGDVLRLTPPAATDPLVREIARLEVRLTLEAAPQAGLQLPWEVHVAQPAGAARPATKQAAAVLEFPAGQDPPAVGDAILVQGGGASVAFTVKAQPADRRRELDRALPAALTAPLTWRPISTGRRLGRALLAAAGAVLTYEPIASGEAPAAATALMLVAGSNKAARTVVSVEADELVLNAALAGVAAAAAVNTARVTLGAPDVKDTRRETVDAVALAPVVAAGHTLVLHQLTTAAVAAGALELVHDAARAGDVATVTLPAGAAMPAGEAASEGPTPGQLVVLVPDSGGPLPAIVSRVRVTVTLDRRLSFPAAVAAAAAAVVAPPPPPAPPLLRNLDVFPLAAAGPWYATDQLGPRRVLLRPEVRVGSVTRPVEMPRVAPGDLVEIKWDGAPATRLHRITKVDGCAATLDPDGGALPVNTPNLAVRRLDTVNPGTGTTRLARAGDLLALRAAETDLQAEVWQPNALLAGSTVAVSDGTLVLPARVRTRTRLEVEWLPAGVPAAATRVSITVPSLTGPPRVVASATIEGADVLLDGLLNATGTSNRVLAVDYATQLTRVTGKLDPGSVLVPEEPTVELSRREALVEHEMVHTEQAAIWGPLFLSPLPSRGLEDLYQAIAGEPLPDVVHRVLRLWSVGGSMNFITSSIVSLLAWVLFKLVFFFVRLFSGAPLTPGWLGHADWLPFFPASVPSPTAQPSRIALATAGSPALGVGDLVELAAGTTFRRATVTAVAGTTVDLDTPAPTATPLTVALVAANDGVSTVEHAVMRHTGFGGLEVPFDYAFDPWGTIADRGHFKPGSFEDILFKCARDLFGSSSWSLYPFSYLFFDNQLRQLKRKGHLSKMEQSASGASGELYSSLARLDGPLEFVGDVARYWHWPIESESTVVAPERADAPGVHVLDLLRVLPSAREDPALATAPPNGQHTSAPDSEGPGGQVPDVFCEKDATDPLKTPTLAQTPRGLVPSARAAVPISPRVERSSGAYVAFTRRAHRTNGTVHAHRLTSPNGIADAPNVLEAQEAGRQEIWFDRDPQDVTVLVGGRTVAEGDRLQLVRGQLAAVVVTPGGARRYAASVLQPATGLVLRTASQLELVAQGTNGIEPVQIDRIYRWTPPAGAVPGSFDHPALQAHGMHLPADVRIPVRRFEVEVVDTVPARATPDPSAAGLAVPSHSGDTVYLAVPAPQPAGAPPPLALSSITYPGGRPALVTDPSPSIVSHASSAAAAALLGVGGTIWRITLGVADPPEAPVQLEFLLNVALADGTGDVSCLLAVDPHFTLDAPGYTVARGARLSLACSGGVTPGAVTVTPGAGIVSSTAGSTVHLDVGAAGATGTHTVLVTDSAAAGRRARRTFTVTP